MNLTLKNEIDNHLLSRGFVQENGFLVKHPYKISISVLGEYTHIFAPSEENTYRNPSLYCLVDNIEEAKTVLKCVCHVEY